MCASAWARKMDMDTCQGDGNCLVRPLVCCGQLPKRDSPRSAMAAAGQLQSRCCKPASGLCLCPSPAGVYGFQSTACMSSSG